MRTIILPGFSPKNKEWAEVTQKSLNSFGPVSIAYWDHWQTGKTEPNWLEKGTEKLAQSLRSEPANLLAKSIGTLIAMNLLSRNRDTIDKVILCGLPLNDLSDDDKKAYKVLADFPVMFHKVANGS